MQTPIWPYITPGISDDLFERLPGIPMSKCEVRLLMIGHLRLRANSILWDIGAGTGTIPVETGLMCPNGRVVAIERDEDVAELIKINCQKFGVKNVEIIVGNAPECLETLKEAPDRICIEGGRSVKEILEFCWQRLAIGGRVIATANTLEGLYGISEGFAQLQVRNVEVVQSSVNRLEARGTRQTFAAVNPIFILSGEKLE
ncbi:precorrin-6Y C5,15-methyltransferase subunit CbiT [Tumidithrix elongata RA019]|uniref:Precorrin-6Y C5,15-methyltransferase subunit CbiT n=1 Tax=Tumidithrix elongata BACA0141 TaxID=2716417 RepID=A0AAW9Q4D2_9CYAN|nr:precorrin-6Y C5,15-methyltransferase subunit CbiT [Tumidithrix elongata RA019]